jgi:predicted transcriptional regulator
MNPGSAVLLSIRPQYVDQIFNGTKTVELRRVRPRVEAGDLVVVYSSGSQKSLVGAFQIAEVLAISPGSIWRRFGSKTGISKAELDRYFEGLAVGFAIEVGRTWKLASPVHLSALRRLRGGFHAPQSYRYLDLSEVFHLGGEALLGGADALTEKSSGR